MKPQRLALAMARVKLIRSSGGSAYESLVVQCCGTRGGSLVVVVEHVSFTTYYDQLVGE